MALGKIAIAMAALSTVAGVAGAIQQGRQAKKQAEYNAAVARNEAEAARQKAAYDEQMHRQRLRKMLSSQRASYAKSGVSLEGSPLLGLEETVREGELDALAIRYGGEIGAGRAESQAKMFEMQGKQAKRSSFAKAGQTLLSGASSTYGAYKNYKKSLT